MEGFSQREVRFSLATNGISLKRGQNTFMIALTLNDEGRCKLSVDGGPQQEQWQVRRMALEGLFFSFDEHGI
jgi:hypothetical protein